LRSRSDTWDHKDAISSASAISISSINVAGRVDSCGNGTTITYGNQCFPYYSTGSFINTPLYYVNQIETSALSNYNSLQATMKVQGCTA